MSNPNLGSQFTRELGIAMNEELSAKQRENSNRSAHANGELTDAGLAACLKQYKQAPAPGQKGTKAATCTLDELTKKGSLFITIHDDEGKVVIDSMQMPTKVFSKGSFGWFVNGAQTIPLSSEEYPELADRFADSQLNMMITVKNSAADSGAQERAEKVRQEKMEREQRKRAAEDKRREEQEKQWQANHAQMADQGEQQTAPAAKS